MEFFVLKYPELKKCTDKSGFNGLHLAAWLGGIKVTRFLIDGKHFKIRNDSNDKKWNAAFCACRGSKFDQLEFILKKKPDLVKSVDESGENLLEVAESYNKDDRLIELLTNKYKMKTE